MVERKKLGANGQRHLTNARKIASLAIVCVVLAGCQKRADVPSFKIRNLDMVLSLQSAQAQKLLRSCNTVKESTTCEYTGAPFADAYFAQTNLTFENGKLSQIESNFMPEDLGRVRDNLIGAYGPPCAEESGELKSDIGPGPGNHRLYWCFKEGRLLLEQFTYGARTDRSLLEFPALARGAIEQKKPADL